MGNAKKNNKRSQHRANNALSDVSSLTRISALRRRKRKSKHTHTHTNTPTPAPAIAPALVSTSVVAAAAGDTHTLAVDGCGRLIA
jgi:hypothetical protein